MKEHETIVDIIAEIRALSNPISDGIIAINGRIIADRLEAANRRERGDCAKLREALEKVIEIANKEWDASRETSAMWEIWEICKAALAAPARNCDVGTAEEQAQRFDAFCDAHKYVGDDGANWCSRTCPCYNHINCGVNWAQMPYEGGAK